MLDLFNYITYLSSCLQRCNVMLYSIYLSWTLCCYDYVADAKKNIQDWTRNALLSGSVRSHLQSAFGVWTITYDLVIRVVLYNLQITWLVTRVRLFFFLLAMCILLGRVGRTFSEPCINSMYNAVWIKSSFNKKKKETLVRQNSEAFCTFLHMRWQLGGVISTFRLSVCLSGQRER